MFVKIIAIIESKTMCVIVYYQVSLQAFRALRVGISYVCVHVRFDVCY